MSIFSLRNKYDHFIVPAFKITVGGTDITRLCSRVVTDQAVGAVSGGCSFTLPGIYNEGTRKLLSDIGSLQVGKTVNVSVGYGSSLKPVFTGYISQMEYRFEKAVELEVICLDARALMRRSRPVIINKGKTVEDIANAVLGKYSPLIGSKEVSLPKLIGGNIAVEKNDLDFIMDECELRGKVFFIRDSKAFITDPKGELCLTLDWAEYHLTHRISYLNCKYNGIGLDFATMEGYTETAAAKQRGSQTNMTPQEIFIPLDPSYSQSAGKSIIKAIAQSDALNSQTGTVTCFGMPDIEVGKTVKLSKSPIESISGGDTFFVTAVKHTIDKVFTTEFEFSLGI